MAYQRYGGGYGGGAGTGGRFGPGVGNPSMRPNSVKPTDHLQPGGRRGGDRVKPWEPNPLAEVNRLAWEGQSKPPSGLSPEWKKFQAAKKAGYFHNPNAQGSQGRHRGRKQGGSQGFWANINRQRNERLEGGAGPEIPEYKGYAGTMWQEPDQDPIDPRVDTRAIVDATRHTIDERMAREGGEAAAALGRLGVLSSGGGQGMGYAGTLGESERARDRDLAGMYYQYDYDAAQQDANRAASAREGRMGRSLAAHEGYAGREYGSTMGENDYNRWNYGAQLDAEDRRKMEEMMMMYGN